MKIHRLFFLVGSLWELLRFLLLFLALGITFRRELLIDTQAIFWLVLLGSANLLMPAGLLFLYLDPDRHRNLLNLIRMGKLLGLLSALLLILLEPIGTSLSGFALSFLPSTIAPFSILLFISVSDLLFLFLLFSYRRERNRETQL